MKAAIKKKYNVTVHKRRERESITTSGVKFYIVKTFRRKEVMSYVLPNRKAFADSVTRTLLKYRKIATDAEDADVDLCAGMGGTNIRELLPHQKVVRDYLMIETPYRGLLLYHGLGSGKTCSSIAVAESLLSTKKVFVMLPASLEQNYKGELRKCGDPLYTAKGRRRERAVWPGAQHRRIEPRTRLALMFIFKS